MRNIDLMKWAKQELAYAKEKNENATDAYERMIAFGIAVATKDVLYKAGMITIEQLVSDNVWEL